MTETAYKQTCPQCKGHPTTNEAPEGAAMSYWTTCDYCMGEGTVPVLLTMEQIEEAVRAWVADANVVLEKSFKDWNDAVQRGDKPSMSIMYEPGGVWEWIRQRLTSQQEGGVR